MRTQLVTTFTSLLLLSYLSAVNAAQPNIVLVLADDLGYGDLGCYGSADVHTPHLDAFAKQGLRYTACYSAHPTCSPSRTALMTGRTPTRVGVLAHIPYGSTMHVRSSEITIATLLQRAGYATCHVGKWHMNGQFNRATQPQPDDHGFSHWFSTQNNALPNHKDPHNFVRNGSPVGPLKGYSADLVMDEAIHWLADIRDRSQPFFLYVCFHEPHEPIATDPKFAELYPSDDPSYSAHHGNISQMDAAFGRLLEELDRQEVSEETLVFFTSDNGPANTRYHPHGSSGGLRDKKGSVFEGGIRVPGMVRWPGMVPAGRTSAVPISGVDFLPTVCSIAGIAPPQDRTLDGADISATFHGDSVKRSTPLYWHFYRASSASMSRTDRALWPRVAVRDGDLKVMASLDYLPRPGNDLTDAEQDDFKQAELKTFMYFDLRHDEAESEDLQPSPELLKLQQRLREKYREVRDESPRWPAWKHEYYERDRIQWPDYSKVGKGVRSQ